jgi:enoyl-CoA hydratase/carnithine racemase
MISVVCVPKIGVSAARRLFLTGERFGAAEALRLGLVHEVVPPGGLEAAVLATLDTLRLAGPAALAEAKRLAAGGAGTREAFRKAEEVAAEMFGSREAKEGFAAFAERRQPEWAEPPPAEPLPSRSLGL